MGTTEKVPDESSRLLSCPWCGSKEIEDAEMPHNQSAMICEQCGAGGPVCEYNDQSEEAWNDIASLRALVDEIQSELMKKVEPRPFDREGKKDGNYNFIHQEDVADAFGKVRNLLKR